jgi:hypothetical protein
LIEKQTDGHITWTVIETDRQTYREIKTDKYRETNRQRDKQTDKHADREIKN